VLAFDYAGGFNGVYGYPVQNGNPSYNIAGPRPADGFPGFSTANMAAYFSGFFLSTSCHVTVPPWNLNTNTVTLTAWLYPDAVHYAKEGVIVCRAGTTVAGLGYSDITNTNGNYTLSSTWGDNVWISDLEVPPSQWSLVALVITPLNTTIYILNTNGMQSAVNVKVNRNVAFDGNTLIGWDSGGTLSRTFNGVIDNVAVFNRSLSQEDVINLFQAAWGTNLSIPVVISQQPGSKTLYAGYTADFSVVANGHPPPSYQWQVENNGNYVNLNDGGGISGSTTATLTISNVAAVNAGDYVVVVTNASGSVTSSVATLTVVALPVGDYAAAVLSNHPVAFYELNESGDPVGGGLVALDYVGGYNGVYGTNAQNGNLNYNIAGPRPAGGFPGFPANNTAAQFTNNVDDSRVTLPVWNLQSNHVTLTAWVNPAKLIARGAIVFGRWHDWGGGSPHPAFGLSHSSATNANGFFTLSYNWNNDSGSYNWNSGLALPTNQWSLVSLVVTPTNATIYVINTNGLRSSVRVLNHAPFAMTNGVSWIGYDPNGPPTSTNNTRTFDGMIDDVALFNHALSPDDVANLYSVAAGVASPIASFTLGPANGRAPLTVNFTNTSTGYDSALWTFGDGNTSTSTNAVVAHTYTSGPATNTVSLTVSNIFGLSATSTRTDAVVVTAPAPVTVYLTPSGANLQLTWSSGTLLEATNVTGPWVTNLTATSPFVVSPTNAQMFFRVRVQ
jgi:hypothetical protein